MPNVVDLLRGEHAAGTILKVTRGMRNGTYVVVKYETPISERSVPALIPGKGDVDGIEFSCCYSQASLGTLQQWDPPQDVIDLSKKVLDDCALLISSA